MKIVAVVILTLISFKSFCQDTDTYQPDSIFRINKVKSRLQQDMSGLNSWQAITNYDSTGKLTTWSLFKEDKEVQKLVYGEENFETTYSDGKIKMQVTVTYNPHIKRTTYFTPQGAVESTIEETYENQFITIRSKGKSPQQTWDYTYKNTFGKNGRISRREVKEGKKTKQTILYQYNTKGLLEMKTTLSDLHPPIIENFTYTYY